MARAHPRQVALLAAARARRQTQQLEGPLRSRAAAADAEVARAARAAHRRQARLDLRVRADLKPVVAVAADAARVVAAVVAAAVGAAEPWCLDRPPLVDPGAWARRDFR